MTLTVNGKLVQLHPAAAALIKAIAIEQDKIWKLGSGWVMLRYDPQRAKIHLFKQIALDIEVQETVDKPAPFVK